MPDKDNMTDKSPDPIGKGQYIAYAEWFACLDEYKSMWSLSRVTMISPNKMQFDYIGEFKDKAEIIAYIEAEANA